MATMIKVGPLTRIEGHLDIEVAVEQGVGVVSAKCSGTMFRGFERILRGRDPRDAPHYTQRICGVCPTAHGMAASMTLESAFGIRPADNGRILRNLILGANFLQSHVLHFYHLALLDYVDASAVPLPPWKPQYVAGDMIKGPAATNLMAHYVQALTVRRQAHQMGAIFGGRMPTPPVFVPGGCSAPVTAAKINDFRALLVPITAFINNVMIPDVEIVAAAFPSYSTLGRGCGNLLAFGVFDLDAAGAAKLLRRGRLTNGALAAVDPTKISEYVGRSYYAAADGNRNPAVGTTTPHVDKPGAYSWIKSPRYARTVHEAGPLARMWVNGDYRGGISVVDRLRARALEAQKIAVAMNGWLNELRPGRTSQQRGTTPRTGAGMGLSEAARGAIGHWMTISNSTIDRYQVITPTAWNASPADDDSQPGPIEQALLGTPVANSSEPVELLRVVHSFDPCLSCSVHVVRPSGEVTRFVVPGVA
jgi:hydrogenase large subunit